MSGDAVVGHPQQPVLRPSIPPLAWFTTGVWSGVALAEALGWHVFTGRLPEAVVAAVPLLAGVCAASSWRVRAALPTLVLAGVLTGAAAGGACWHAWRHDEADVERTSGMVTLRTSSDARDGTFGPSVEAVVTDGAGRRSRLLVRFSRDASAPELGSASSAYGVAKAAATDEPGRRMHRDGVVGTYSVRRQVATRWSPGVPGSIGRARAWCVERVRSVPGPGGALLSGVTLGDRRLLAGTPLEADFRTTGLTHLIAVSGSHLVVVAALVAWVLGRMRARRVVSVCAVLAVVAAYVVATGMQASAIRALVMTGVAVGSVSGGRRVDRAAALAAAAALALVVWPPVAFDVGFALSVASVAGLIVFARLADAWVAGALPKRVAGLGEPLSLTLVAQAATFPIAAPVFGVVSLVAPLANLLVGPLVALMLVMGMAGLATSVASVEAGQGVLHAAGAVASVAAWIAGRLALAPAASVPVDGWGSTAGLAIALGALALWAVWPQPRRAYCRLACIAGTLALAVAAIGPPARGGPQVVVLDVGQGDAVLIRDGPHAALVDAGPDPTALRTALARHGVRGLEFVAFTHAHDDHTGGIGALRGAHSVGQVFISTTSEENAYAGAARELRRGVAGLHAGQRLMVGSILVTVLWPREPVPDVGENGASLVLLVERGEEQVLLTGDAEREVLEPLARSGVLPDVDALKVGHHGSRVSLSAVALAALRPEVAVISVGAGNRFGHPTPESLQLLSGAGCVVRRTDRDGDVVIPLGSSASARDSLR